MKIFLKTTLLATILTHTLMAGTLFDLSAQHFSNSLEGQGEGGRYDFPNVYVSTALKYSSGVYSATNGARQDMAIEIKNPPSNWSVSFDMSDYLYYNIHNIRLTSDTGKTIIVGFRHHEIYLNGTLIYSNGAVLDRRTEISCSISKSGDTITFITGLTTKTITVRNFSKLKFVKAGIATDNGHADLLNGLTIGSN